MTKLVRCTNRLAPSLDNISMSCSMFSGGFWFSGSSSLRCFQIAFIFSANALGSRANWNVCQSDIFNIFVYYCRYHYNIMRKITNCLRMFDYNYFFNCLCFIFFEQFINYNFCFFSIIQTILVKILMVNSIKRIIIVSRKKK